MNLFTATVAAAAIAAAQPSAPALRVSMVSFGVTDMARSVEFYGKTLGLAQRGPAGEVVTFEAGTVMIALNRPLGRASQSAIVGAVEVILGVDHVEQAHAALVERGCRFVRPPREVMPGTYAATFTDPDGHRLTLLGPR